MRPPQPAPAWLWRWGPLILWMGVISLFSTEAFAASETSRYIGPLLRWLFPGASGATLDAVHHVIRKGMHVAEFTLLAMFWYRALAWNRRGWQPGSALGALGLAVLFAVLDETHQAFVATRGASVADVGWDGLGALLGAIGGAVLSRGRERSRVPTCDAPGIDPPGCLKVSCDD